MKLATLLLAYTASAAVIDRNIRTTENPILTSLNYFGTGCPQESIDNELNKDGSISFLNFEHYQARLGPHIHETDNTKNCQIKVGIQLPKGWQYSHRPIDYTGFIELDEGMLALHTSEYTYMLNGKKETYQVKNELNGPAYSEFRIQDELIQHKVWSSCTTEKQIAFATIRNEIFIQGGLGDNGFISIDEMGHEENHFFGLDFRPC